MDSQSQVKVCRWWSVFIFLWLRTIWRRPRHKSKMGSKRWKRQTRKMKNPVVPFDYSSHTSVASFDPSSSTYCLSHFFETFSIFVALWAKWNQSCMKFEKFIKSWIILLKSSKFLSFLSYSSTESRDFEFELRFSSIELPLSLMNFTQHCSCPENKSKLLRLAEISIDLHKEKNI